MWDDVRNMDTSHFLMSFSPNIINRGTNDKGRMAATECGSKGKRVHTQTGKMTVTDRHHCMALVINAGCVSGWSEYRPVRARLRCWEINSLRNVHN